MGFCLDSEAAKLAQIGFPLGELFPRLLNSDVAELLDLGQEAVNEQFIPNSRGSKLLDSKTLWGFEFSREYFYSYGIGMRVAQPNGEFLILALTDGTSSSFMEAALVVTQLDWSKNLSPLLERTIGFALLEDSIQLGESFGRASTMDVRKPLQKFCEVLPSAGEFTFQVVGSHELGEGNILRPRLLSDTLGATVYEFKVDRSARL